jgi:23S rRNA (adenine2503-C2)-methyltransferase
VTDSPEASVSSSIPESVGIKALDTSGLAALMSEFGEPRFRTGQLVKWLYQRGVRDFAEMTDLSTDLRARLAGRFALPSPEIVTSQSSSDGTRKYLLRLADGITVETVGLPLESRLTVCFSTQAGCAMGCSFCATGASGLSRSLSAGEMVDQVNVVASDFGRRVTNAVAMGQGEPFANYSATLGALRLMNSVEGLGIGARHLTVSTCGLIPGIRRLSTEPEQFTLAVSLHSAVQSTRDSLMPGVRGTTLPHLREALVDYAERTGRRPSVEYALIAGVNDTDPELKALIAFCGGLLVHVNLIPMNPVLDSSMERSPKPRVAEFERALSAAHIEASVRTERGTDIDAACGQLRQRSEG